MSIIIRQYCNLSTVEGDTDFVYLNSGHGFNNICYKMFTNRTYKNTFTRRTYESHNLSNQRETSKYSISIEERYPFLRTCNLLTF